MSSDVVIRVENLGKRYRIGSRSSHADDLRHRLNRALTYPFRKLWKGAKSQEQGAEGKPDHDPETNNEEQRTKNEEQGTLWALRDVSFEVRQGEILGVIGRNGAGKSTLLKILSRITEPTTGRVEIRGRIGALLEVGTGFHPELTGRENVYLNGMILGMVKSEIDRQFDAIVDFAGVERFIDTPVKRYSSGMHVRLGFAVAAHLEPEILIVDEVLAVGDVEFQNRCLEQIRDVSTHGRTVLIVSHNLQLIQTLCARVIRFTAGEVTFNGPCHDGVSAYREESQSRATVPLAERTDRVGNGWARLVGLFTDQETLLPGRPCRFCLTIHSTRVFRATLGIGLYTLDDVPALICRSSDVLFEATISCGHTTIECEIASLPLAPGRYQLNLCIEHAGEIVDWVKGGHLITVDTRDYFGTGRMIQERQSICVAKHKWHFGNAMNTVAP